MVHIIPIVMVVMVRIIPIVIVPMIPIAIVIIIIPVTMDITPGQGRYGEQSNQ